jgi:hypothetical protein
VNLAVVLILNGECVDEQVLGSSFLLKLCESDVVKSNLSQAAQQAGGVFTENVYLSTWQQRQSGARCDLSEMRKERKERG